MSKPAENMSRVDPVWSTVRQEAADLAEREPALSGFLHASVLNFERLEQAIASHLAEKLANSEIGARTLNEVIEEAYEGNTEFSATLRADIVANLDRDPACRTHLDPVLY